MLAKALTLGGTGLGVARQLLASMGANGHVPDTLSTANGKPATPEQETPA
jgi:hypothetical protein